MASEKVLTPKFRVSFPAVFVPRSAMDGAEPKYSVVMLFPKEVDLSKLKAIAKQAVTEKWGDKVPKDLRSPFRDGDDKEMDGYAGQIFITASSKMKPGLVNGAREPIIDAGEFYAGCYARATVNAYAYDRNGNRGVAFGLQNIQKLEEGEPFSGRTKPEDDFDAVGDGAPAGPVTKAAPASKEFWD